MASLLQYWRKYQGTRGPTRELLAIGICLGLGLAAMPVLIWVAGSAKLGRYPNGGLGALWHDFFAALLKGSPIFWLVALGPYAALWIWRGARALYR